MPRKEIEPPVAAPHTRDIPLCVPSLHGNEWRYLKECLDGNWVAADGPFVDRFERRLEAICNVQHAVALISGTAALHVALLVAGVQPDDEVLLPALTFIAPANAIRYVGAWPVFIGSDPKFWQIYPDKISDFIKRECTAKAGKLVNRVTGRRVRAIMPVHILGHPAPMNEIVSLARRYELLVIEDASEGLGSACLGQHVGSFGDAACLSFNGNKLITTGGGGALLTNDSDWARKAKQLATQCKSDPIEYYHSSVGYNYRLSNLHAALGVAQLERIEGHIAAKRRIAQEYFEALSAKPGIRVHAEAPWAYSTFWMSTILVLEQDYGMSSRQLLQEFHVAGIAVRPIWRLIPDNPPFRDCQVYLDETDRKLSPGALFLPCSVDLAERDQQRVIDVILRAR